MTGEAATDKETRELKANAGRGHHVVVMGVAGCGKSTVGAALAARIGAHFIDADSLHPASNIALMSAGIPLTDEDRSPWLAEVGRRFSTSDGPLVIACSALKRAYRDIIRNADPSVVFVHLHGSRAVLERRMTTRPGHFMPLTLLDSQLETLENLHPDEAGVVVDLSLPVTDIVEEVSDFLQVPPTHTQQDQSATSL